MLLLIGLLIGGIIIIIAGYTVKESNDSGLGFFGSVLVGLGVLMIIIFIILGIVWLFSYPESLSTVSNMQNFYERNQMIYASAVAEFPDAANIEASQGTANVKKLSWDYTQQVLMYNENLQWYRNYDSHWFVGAFVTKAPEYLKFIDLNKK